MGFRNRRPADAPAITVTDDGAVAIRGVLTFRTVPHALDDLQAAVDAADDGFRIDLSGVTRSDSAGLALLLEAVRLARDSGQELRLTEVPDQIAAMARVADVTGVLGLQ